MSDVLLGRREITTGEKVIDRTNLLDELTLALQVHCQNQAEIQKLWDYYRGKQDILDKVKLVRPEINNKIVVNRANEIVSFKVGYLTGEPITYVSKNISDEVRSNVMKLNEAMHDLDKSSQDRDLIMWDMICGVAYRYISTEEKDGVPFSMYTLDPRYSFVVKSSDITRKPVFAVYYYNKNGTMGMPIGMVPNYFENRVYCVYTENKYYRVEDGQIVEESDHYLGAIPIVEYSANKERQGAFEVAIPLLDALNALYSDRLDNVDSVVQAFLKFVNCDIDSEGLARMREEGAIKIKSESNLPADVDLVSTEINQDQIETLTSSINSQINVICGVPNRNGGLSTSDTGRATELRDGWTNAETKAKDSETEYRRADKESLRIIFNICRAKNYLDLNIQDVESKFTRRNYDNLQSKSQVLIGMLQNAKIHPKLAFTASGMFTDPEEAYQMSMEYYDEQMKNVIVNSEVETEYVDTDGEDDEQRSSKNADILIDRKMSNPVERVDATIN